MILSKRIDTLKGIHPGHLIKRNLENSNMSQRKLATIISVHPQTLNAIITTKRTLDLKTSLKIESYFKLEEGSLMLLQLFYNIKKNKQETQKTPNLALLRSVLFWDTDINKINWLKNKNAVINRVFSRGNAQEKTEIEDFYGKKEVSKVIKKFKWKLNA